MTALVAIGVTIGSPDVSGQVAVTATDGGALLDQATTDLGTLSTNIGTAQTAATAADMQAATVVTDTTTVKNDTATTLTNATTADTDCGTAGTDFDAFAAALIAITGDTYNATTKQFTFGGATGLTHAQLAALTLNTIGADLVTTKTATAAVKTSATTADSDAATAKTDAATLKTNTATAKTACTALSTTTVATDITNAKINFASDVTVRTDTTKCTSTSILNGALQSVLAFVQKQGILP